MTNRTWMKDPNSAGWICEMPGSITLFAVPDKLARHSFTPKPSRGTQWRAGCSHWDQSTSTLSRYGRDAYLELLPSANEAKRLAETIYAEASA